jgi:hypothetical protein
MKRKSEFLESANKRALVDFYFAPSNNTVPHSESDLRRFMTHRMHKKDTQNMTHIVGWTKSLSNQKLVLYDLCSRSVILETTLNRSRICSVHRPFGSSTVLCVVFTDSDILLIDKSLQIEKIANCSGRPCVITLSRMIFDTGSGLQELEKIDNKYEKRNIEICKDLYNAALGIPHRNLIALSYLQYKHTTQTTKYTLDIVLFDYVKKSSTKTFTSLCSYSNSGTLLTEDDTLYVISIGSRSILLYIIDMKTNEIRGFEILNMICVSRVLGIYDGKFLCLRYDGTIKSYVVFFCDLAKKSTIATKALKVESPSVRVMRLSSTELILITALGSVVWDYKNNTLLKKIPIEYECIAPVYYSA